MAATRESIKVVNAGLDETEKGEIILRGVIDPESLHRLKVADYQREVLPLSTINQLMEAIKSGATLPDVDLGMRGGGYTERDEAYYLHNDVYIVDGLQRITAAMQLLRKGEGSPRLGATIHFNTEEKWERERFQMLNTSRVRLSPNVLIRNEKEKYTVIEMMHNLCFDKTFALYDRVTWQQAMQRHHLITAATYIKAAGRLHATFGPGKTSRVTELIPALQKTMNTVGRNVMRENVKTFFGLIDESWGLRSIAYKAGACYVKTTFLVTLADVLTEYKNFWKDTRLSIDANLRKKIASFPVTDPQVIQLASASGQARYILYQLMVNHINSGRRPGKGKLVPFKPATAVSPVGMEEELAEAAGE